MTSPELELRLAAGFLVIVASAVFLNKAGDFFFHRGIAKPFYVLGHRLHHRSVLQTLVPISYGVVAILIYLHYLRVQWVAFWPSLEITVLLSVACVGLDMFLDAQFSGRDKRETLLHHEWLYLLVPVYAFTHFVALV